MPSLRILLERLKSEQADLMLEADEDLVPCRDLLRRIASLENAIRSVEALIEDR